MWRLPFENTRHLIRDYLWLPASRLLEKILWTLRRDLGPSSRLNPSPGTGPWLHIATRGVRQLNACCGQDLEMSFSPYELLSLGRIRLSGARLRRTAHEPALGPLSRPQQAIS